MYNNPIKAVLKKQSGFLFLYSYVFHIDWLQVCAYNVPNQLGWVGVKRACSQGEKAARVPLRSREMPAHVVSVVSVVSVNCRIRAASGAASVLRACGNVSCIRRAGETAVLQGNTRVSGAYAAVQKKRCRRAWCRWLRWLRWLRWCRSTAWYGRQAVRHRFCVRAGTFHASSRHVFWFAASSAARSAQRCCAFLVCSLLQAQIPRPFGCMNVLRWYNAKTMFDIPKKFIHDNKKG
jgi:hypothetical protein